MLLKAEAWGSDEWYSQVLPTLAAAGLTEREDLHASDPESDGELMYAYFELTTDELPLAEFQKVVAQVQALLDKARLLPVKLALVPSR